MTAYISLGFFIVFGSLSLPNIASISNSGFFILLVSSFSIIALKSASISSGPFYKDSCNFPNLALKASISSFEAGGSSSVDVANSS